MQTEDSAGAATLLSSSPEKFSWQPLVASINKVDALWESIMQLPAATAHEPQFKSMKAFVEALSQPRNLFYEVGEGLGLVTILDVEPRLTGSLKATFFDRKLRGKEQVVQEIARSVFDELKLERLTAYEPSRRETTCNFLMRCGFKLEGVLRRGYRDGNVSDLCVFGLLAREAV